MRVLKVIGGLLVTAAVLSPSTSAAQRPGELVLYSDMAFRGQTYALNGPRDYISLPWPARSARVTGRGTWEVCPRARYRGQCNTFSSSQVNIRWVVGSARPTDRAVTLPAPIPPVGGVASLRGMAAEFFPAPDDERGRVPSCPSGGAGCAADRAEQFCRQRGWNGAAHSSQQTVGSRNYLADVLCTRTGH